MLDYCNGAHVVAVFACITDTSCYHFCASVLLIIMYSSYSCILLTFIGHLFTKSCPFVIIFINIAMCTNWFRYENRVKTQKVIIGNYIFIIYYSRYVPNQTTGIHLIISRLIGFPFFAPTSALFSLIGLYSSLQTNSLLVLFPLAQCRTKHYIVVPDR